MAFASKLLSLTFALCLVSTTLQAQAATRTTPSAAPSSAARRVAELQFELARSLANAGEHEAAAREFDRAMQLQRQADTATPEQTGAALQTLHAYVQSRPELPRIAEIARRLPAVERQVQRDAPRSGMMPTAAIGAAEPVQSGTRPSASAGIVPNAPPSQARAVAEPMAANPYHESSKSRSRRRARAVSVSRRQTPGLWWEQIVISHDELLVPAEWSAAIRNTPRGNNWPQLVVAWPDLLIPEGWEAPNFGLAALRLAETELLVPPGW